MNSKAGADPTFDGVESRISAPCNEDLSVEPRLTFEPGFRELNQRQRQDPDADFALHRLVAMAMLSMPTMSSKPHAGVERAWRRIRSPADGGAGQSDKPEGRRRAIDGVTTIRSGASASRYLAAPRWPTIRP